MHQKDCKMNENYLVTLAKVNTKEACHEFTLMTDLMQRYAKSCDMLAEMCSTSWGWHGANLEEPKKE